MNGTFRLLLALAAIALVLGCGSSTPSVNPGPMPDGGTYSGVYFSPQYGEMHLVQSGTSVRGTYKKDERSGKIQGEAEGNLLRFEWTEYKAMVANRPQETVGHGYFQYLEDKANGDHVLKGRWGVGDESSTGGEWNAYKAKSREPDPDSLLGESESSGGESLYDDEGGGEDDFGSDDALDEDDGAGLDDGGDDLFD